MSEVVVDRRTLRQKRGLRYGYVRSRDVVRAIDDALRIEGEWQDDDERLQPLTRYWPIDDLKKMLYRRRWIEFNFADRILCLLGLPHLWIGPLADIYARVNLREGAVSRPRTRVAPRGQIRCAGPGCVETFVPKRLPQGGGRPQRYCSIRCRQAADARRRWEPRRVGRYGSPYDRCVNGHDRSPENTYISPSGKRLCRGCARDNARKTRRRRRERKES